MVRDFYEAQLTVSVSRDKPFRLMLEPALVSVFSPENNFGHHIVIKRQYRGCYV